MSEVQVKNWMPGENEIGLNDKRFSAAAIVRGVVHVL